MARATANGRITAPDETRRALKLKEGGKCCSFKMKDDCMALKHPKALKFRLKTVNGMEFTDINSDIVKQIKNIIIGEIG